MPSGVNTGINGINFASDFVARRAPDGTPIILPQQTPANPNTSPWMQYRPQPQQQQPIGLGRVLQMLIGMGLIGG